LFDLFEKFPICIFSLSERGDLLSQWRGYCPPSGGYSIGFSSKLLIQFLKTRDLCLKPCVYDEKEQQAMVKQAITERGQTVLKSLSNPVTEIKEIFQKCFVDFFMEFSQIASILKHSSFYEEGEWRIISGPIGNQLMSFRVVSKSMFLPYLAIEFIEPESFPVDEIIIGPAPEQSLARLSLLQFLLKKGLNISIKVSNIPYRELI